MTLGKKKEKNHMKKLKIKVSGPHLRLGIVCCQQSDWKIYDPRSTGQSAHNGLVTIAGNN